MNLNATILGQAISFLLFVWFCMKYIWPPIILAIETRQTEIKESLMNSKKAQDELLCIQKKINLNIKEAKEKASTIVNEAYLKKGLILDQARKHALEESKKIFLDTKSEIEVEIRNVRKNLHKEIVSLSISIAEKIIKKNISLEENKELLNELVVFLSQVKI